MGDEVPALDPAVRGSIERFFAEEIPFNREPRDNAQP